MKYLFFLLSFIFIVFNSFRGAAQKLDTIYNYPMGPENPDWKNLETLNERYNALQIPESLLKEMSTESLIITCINYPMIGDIISFPPQIGMRRIISKFNGLSELMKRTDAADKFVEFYNSMMPEFFYINDSRISKRIWSIRRCYFELMLAQDELLYIMDQQTKDKLLNEAHSKIYLMMNNSKEYSYFNYQTKFFLIVKILDKSSIEEFQLKKNIDADLSNFILTGETRTDSTMTYLLDESYKYLKLKGL